MFKIFVLKGHRDSTRSYEERLTLNNTEAELAFKKYKTQILEEYLKQNGFLNWKTNAYVRRNPIDLLECIDLQKELRQSKTFTVNIGLMPLYVQDNPMNFEFGGRLGNFIARRDIWWDYANDEIAAKSFQNITIAIDRFVFPWFIKYSDEKKFRRKLEWDKFRSHFGYFLGYHNKQWIMALENETGKNELIADNIKRLKLPKELL